MRPIISIGKRRIGVCFLGGYQNCFVQGLSRPARIPTTFQIILNNLSSQSGFLSHCFPYISILFVAYLFHSPWRYVIARLTNTCCDFQSLHSCLLGSCHYPSPDPAGLWNQETLPASSKSPRERSNHPTVEKSKRLILGRDTLHLMLWTGDRPSKKALEALRRAWRESIRIPGVTIGGTFSWSTHMQALKANIFTAPLDLGVGFEIFWMTCL